MRAVERFLELIFGIALNLSARHVPASNTAASVTLAARPTGERYLIRTIECGYTADPTGGQVTIYDVGTPIFSVPITKGGTLQLMPDRIMSPASAVTVTLTAGGSGITGHLNVGYGILP